MHIIVPLFLVYTYNTLIEVGLANILKEPSMPVISPRFLCRQTAFFLLEPWDTSNKKMLSDGRGISD